MSLRHEIALDRRPESIGLLVLAKLTRHRCGPTLLENDFRPLEKAAIGRFTAGLEKPKSVSSTAL